MESEWSCSDIIKHANRLYNKQPDEIDSTMYRYDENLPDDKQKFLKIHNIMVGSEEDKIQLLKALEYLHNCDIDTDYMAVNLYLNPEMILVEESKNS